MTIAAGPIAAVICVPPRAYTCGHLPGDALNQITDPDFPGASSVCYVDGYFAFSSLGDTSQWFISRLLDPTKFRCVGFVFSRCDAQRRSGASSVAANEVWTIRGKRLKVWYDAGSSGLETTTGVSFFPFRRMAGGVVPIGTGSPLAVCKADNSVWWVGLDGMVYRSNGYTPKPVSTHAIEADPRRGELKSAYDAVTHAYRGHWFYCFDDAG